MLQLQANEKLNVGPTQSDRMTGWRAGLIRALGRPAEQESNFGVGLFIIILDLASLRLCSCAYWASFFGVYISHLGSKKSRLIGPPLPKRAFPDFLVCGARGKYLLHSLAIVGRLCRQGSCRRTPVKVCTTTNSSLHARGLAACSLDPVLAAPILEIPRSGTAHGWRRQRTGNKDDLDE